MKPRLLTTRLSRFSLTSHWVTDLARIHGSGSERGLFLLALQLARWDSLPKGYIAGGGEEHWPPRTLTGGPGWPYCMVGSHRNWTRIRWGGCGPPSCGKEIHALPGLDAWSVITSSVLTSGVPSLHVHRQIRSDHRIISLRLISTAPNCCHR